MDEPIKIIHFSDTHITPRPQFMVQDFNNTVNTINSTPHDFAIFSGDLTQDGLAEEFELASEMRKKIISPKLYWIIGNEMMVVLVEKLLITQRKFCPSTAKQN